MPAIGEPYVPAAGSRDILPIPLWLARAPLAPGPKLCWGVLARHVMAAAKRGAPVGTCCVGHAEIAIEIGVSVDSVKIYLRQLREAGLIETMRRGLGNPNIIRLTWSKWAEEAESGNAR